MAAIYKQRKIISFLDMRPKDQTRYIQSFPSIVTLGEVIKLMINTGRVYGVRITETCLLAKTVNKSYRNPHREGPSWSKHFVTFVSTFWL